MRSCACKLRVYAVHATSPTVRVRPCAWSARQKIESFRFFDAQCHVLPIARSSATKCGNHCGIGRQSAVQCGLVRDRARRCAPLLTDEILDAHNLALPRSIPHITALVTAITALGHALPRIITEKFGYHIWGDISDPAPARLRSRLITQHTALPPQLTALISLA